MAPKVNFPPAPHPPREAWPAPSNDATKRPKTTTSEPESMFGNGSYKDPAEGQHVTREAWEDEDHEEANIYNQLFSKPLWLPLEYKEITSTMSLVGSLWRSPITGEVSLKHGEKFPEFSLVDFKCREDLTGSLQKLAKDKFIFKAVAMGNRSWVYQSLVKHPPAGEQFGGSDQFVKETMVKSLVDAPVSGGCWSPVCTFVFTMFVTPLTGDLMIVFISWVILGLLYFISAQLNTQKNYFYTRALCLPVKLGFLIYVIVANNFRTTISVVGSVATILGLVADSILGDIPLLTSLRYHCHYQLVKDLNDRCWVYKRIGAAFFEEEFGDRGWVGPEITGLALWEKRFILVADIRGLLCELRPMTRKDWIEALEAYRTNYNPVPYVWVDLFGVVESRVGTARGSTAASQQAGTTPGQGTADSFWRSATRESGYDMVTIHEESPFSGRLAL